jgi:hypothetical protein
MSLGANRPLLIAMMPFILSDHAVHQTGGNPNVPRLLLQTISGDPCAGYVFQLPVRTLGAETIPCVSEPPGKSADFQVHAGFPLAMKDSKKISSPS